jgi:hypothetical protein
MFMSAGQARDAAAALRAAGFPEDRIHVVVPPTPGSETSADAVAAAVMAGYVLRSQARVYAEGIIAGRALVVVHAAFGRGVPAMQILDSFGPTDSGVEARSEPGRTWDEAAPLSSALALPVRSSNPAPLSTLLGLSPLGRSGPGGLGKLCRHDWTFSSKLGMGLLSRNATPLSSRLGLKVLRGAAAPLSSMLGLKLLCANPAPFSSLFGLPLLSRSR